MAVFYEIRAPRETTLLGLEGAEKKSFHHPQLVSGGQGIVAA